MELTLNGYKAHAVTGGVTLEADAPTLILIHGAGMDSTVWQMQNRYMAHRGVRVLAVDLPGHGQSDGDVISSVEAMADWTIAFMDAASCQTVSVAGHSMGSLVALEVASRAPERMRNIALLGCAAEMPVHPDLIQAAQDGGKLAPGLITDWGFGNISHTGGHIHPGLWAMGAAEQLLRGAKPGALANDLIACNAYKNALNAAANITGNTHIISADEDKMTPSKNARLLSDAIETCEMTVLSKTGHMMMLERPREVAKMLLEAGR